MQFREAWFELLNGAKIKRPHWAGYWKWENNTIMIHTREGEVLDIRATTNPAYTFTNVAARDWEAHYDAAETRKQNECKKSSPGTGEHETQVRG